MFNEQTKPVADYYDKIEKLHKFDAKRSVDVIYQEVEKHLDSIGVFPKISKQVRPKAIIILGNSGSGKSTQCKNIA